MYYFLIFSSLSLLYYSIDNQAKIYHNPLSHVHYISLVTLSLLSLSFLLQHESSKL